MFNFVESSGTKQKITWCNHHDKVWLSILMLLAWYSWWSSCGSMRDGISTPTSYLSRSRFRFVCREHTHLTCLAWKSQRLKSTPGGTRNLNSATLQGFKSLFSVIHSFVTWWSLFQPWWQKACSGCSWFGMNTVKDCRCKLNNWTAGLGSPERFSTGVNATSTNRSEVVWQLVSVPAVMTGEVGDLCLTQRVAV